MTIRQKIILALIVLFALVCWIVVRQTNPRAAYRELKVNQGWQARAEATADDPKAARQVILDAIYAGKTIIVAQAYEEALQEKPWRTNRIITFAHAAEVMNRYSTGELAEEHNNSNERCEEIFATQNHARKLIKSLILPANPADMPPAANANVEIEIEDRKNFQPTKSADAWLAWANFAGDPGGYAAYQKAIQLDPNFGESYYELGSTYTFSRIGKMQHPTEAIALQYLSRAEKLEPKLHPLVTFQRYLIAEEDGHNKAAASYLREYLRLWPNAYHAKAAQWDLTRLEAKK